MAKWIVAAVKSPIFRRLVINAAALGAAYLTADQLGYVTEIARAVAPCP